MSNRNKSLNLEAPKGDLHPSNPAAKIIAHRGGLHPDHPQLDLISRIRKSAQMGVKMSEVDIRRTSDHILLCEHDESIGPHKISETRYDDLIRYFESNRIPVPPKLDSGDLQVFP